MKVYVVKEVTFEAEAPDGAMCLAIGAGNPMITMIDWERERLCRWGQEEEPFPASWYRPGDLAWRPVAR